MMAGVQVAILDHEDALRMEAIFKRWQNREKELALPGSPWPHGARFLLALKSLSLTS